MNYVIDYSICSSAFLIVIVWLYFRQKKLPTLRNKLFLWILILSILSIILDITTAVMDYYAPSIPYSVLVATNSLFLLLTQLIPIIYCLYTFVLVGKMFELKSWYSFLSFLPFIPIFVILILPFFSDKGAFIINATTHYYEHGPTHFILYIVACLIFMFCLSVTVFAKNVARKKKNVVYFYLSTVVISMILQSTLEKYLLNCTANVLSIMVIYFEIEAPNDYIDHLTHAYNEPGFFDLAKEYFLQDKKFSLIVFTYPSYITIQQEYGLKTASSCLKAKHEELKKLFKSGLVFRVKTNSFYVVINNFSFEKEDISELTDSTSKSYIENGTEIVTPTKIGLIRSIDYRGDFSMYCAVLEFLLHDLITSSSFNNDIIVANHTYYDHFALEMSVDSAIADIVEQNTVQVHYQPIHDKADHISGLEALARCPEIEGKTIPAQTFIRGAERSGAINRLGQQIFEKVAMMIGTGLLEKHHIDYVSVNLSMSQVLQSDIADQFKELADKYKADPHRIIFEITESEALQSPEIIEKRLKQFQNYGFRLSLDDFGTGYSNFSYMFLLPFDIVKVDKSLLDNAMKEKKASKILRSIIKIIEEMNFTTIVEGVETEKEALLLNKYGAYNHQGFFYAKPMPLDDLKEYIKKFDNHVSKKKN